MTVLVEKIGEVRLPISGNGWEILITRKKQHKRANKSYARTVGDYQVFHNGTKVAALSGMLAERQGPGDNTQSGVTNHRRIAAGTYELSTHDGASNNKYKTIGYSTDPGLAALPRPCFRFLGTGARSGILLHPGAGYLYSIGCFNPGTTLDSADDNLKWGDSRTRVIALLDDMKQFLGNQFPTSNNQKIPNAHAVVEGEPT